MKRRLWSSVVVVTVTVLLCGGTPALPVRADTPAQPAPGGGWKPASKRGFWDRLLGRHDGRSQPKTRDTTVQAVPRHDRVPAAGKPTPPAKRVRELTGRRTANARFWQLSDGRTQEELSQQPINYRSGDGWKPIDTTVTPTARSGFAYGSEANSFHSYFGSRPGALVRVEQDGAAVTIGLDDGSAGAKIGAPKVAGDTVSYTDAVSGATLAYQVTPEGLKERIVLAKAPAAAPSWDFTIKTAGLRAWQRPDGSIGFYRGDFDGQPVFVMPKPFMTDSKADGASPYGKAWSPGVAQAMRWDAAAGVLRVRVNADAGWLADPARAYPVTIDPTIKIQPLPESSQDTMIISDDPSSNFESSPRLSVGTTTTGVARSLVRFPLTGVPAGTPIDSADLQLYYDQYHTDNSQAVTLEAHRATAAWDETTATWNNANNNVGELGANQETVDDGDAGKTAAVGAWPASTNGTLAQYGVNGDYLFNKDAVAGDSYTWVPRITEDGDYRVEVHYVAASDRATNAPYTVTYSGGAKAYTVNQQTGTNGVWTTLGTHPFAAGGTGKVVLGDGPASTSTAVIADAVRLTKDGSVVRPAGDQGSHWHTFPVRNIVQSWVNGSNPNYGFVIKAKDEATLGMGGPRYEGGVYNYGGETEQYPRLLITYGRPGVAVNQPTTVHATGAELTWPTYKDPSGSSADDIVEYQVHRSIFQNFTPSAATLVAPVAPGTTAFTDSTATPTPADSTDPFGRLYYYMVAVKTRDGQLVAGPTQIVRLPKAGRVVKIFQAGATDTTLTSAQPTTNQDRLAGQPWLEVGDSSTTYGKARAVLKFPVSGIPTSATVLDARFDLWTVEENGNATATYDLHGLTRDFAETTATWNSAASGTAWTTPGGDYTSAVAGSVSPITNDPARRSIHAASLVQGWISTPGSNHGVLVKLANETTPAERSLFLSSEAEEPQLRPELVVSYVEPTAGDTYYAPETPALTTPATAYPVDVTLTNPTASTWTKADWVLSYRWTLPDGTDVTGPANQVQTALPKDVVAGDTVTVNAQVKTPTQADPANNRTDYTLNWDLFNKTTGQWLSGFGTTPATPSGGTTALAAGGVPIPSLPQKVAVDEPTSDQLGLEKFYQYAGDNTGAGGTAMTNLYSGNTVWSYNAFAHPGRGASTFVRMAYNSLDTSDSSMGFGWSLQASSLMRLGSPLDFHPNPNPTSVTLTDGDGTSHLFTWDSATSTWVHPKGVHLFLQQIADCKPGNDKDPEPRAWQMTRPDRTQFIFGCDGYLNALVDKNGNEQDFVWTQRHSANKPTKFLAYITDPAGRQTLTLDYYAKGDSYTWIDDTGAEQSGTNLTNPFIIDHVRTITDIAGRKVTFTYTDKGLMAKMVDGAGDAQAKTFRFAYDMTQGNKNVKLVKVTDPRGHDTTLDYYFPQTGDDPQFHWRNKTITDRLGGLTQFAYTDPDGPQGSTIRTIVTDAESHATTYLMDGFGRPTQATNAKNQTTELTWDTDHNVIRLEENNGAVTTYSYDTNTGYPLTTTDAEANKNGTPGTVLTYQTGLGGHIADLISKKSPEGRLWTFGYNATGNLTSVTDPDGNATTTAGDFTTTYTYDSFGQLRTETDANHHTTTYGSFDPNGYPRTITDADPRHNVTQYDYDSRGNVVQVTDPLGHHTTQNYDIFGRPLDGKAPKKESAGEFITTPAPIYDANDNVTQATTPAGAVSTATYDDNDQVLAAFAPKDSPTGPERKTAYTYDKVGNVTTVTEPLGNKTTVTYDEIYEQTATTDDKGHTTSYTFDGVGNVVTTVDPKKNATPDPADYTTKYAYDLNHRPTQVTDASGKFKTTDYDRDGLTLATTDEDGNKTLYTLDARGATTQVKTPHKSSGGTITYNTTQYEYDQVGNQTKVITPRGVATGSVPDDFVQQTTYDELNRVKEKLTPYDPGDARYNTPNKTIYSYDKVGRLDTVSAPPSEGQTVRNDTKYTYFDNGWTETSSDPWDILTSYDYDADGRQTLRKLTPAGDDPAATGPGSSVRTLSWSFYPDGKLKSRADEGVPVGSHTVLVDDSDFQNAGSTGGAWTASTSGTGFQGFDYATHAAGTGTSSWVWNLTIPQDGNYDVYVKYPSGVSGAASNASYTIRSTGGATATKTVDQRSGGGTWVSLGRFAFTRDGTGQQISLSDSADGTLLADAVKVVRDNSTDVDNEQRDFTYSYDVNGNLTDVADHTPGARFDDYTIGYDGLNQVAKVEEKKSGVVKHTTSFVYDENGNTKTRLHDDATATYDYDVRDLLAKVTDQESATAPAKTTSFTYTPGGQVATQTKGNGNVVTSGYFLDGALQHQVEKKPDGSVVDEHTFDYDPNGNKTQDVAKKQNADNHSAFINTTTDYTYDPLDRIATATKSGDHSSTEKYVHDANNNVISETVGGSTTTSNYDRNRLMTTVVGGITSSYNYDPFGRLDTVTTGGQLSARYTYDGFDHIATSEKRVGGALTTTKFTYDPFDRTVTQTADAGGAKEKTTTFNYLAMSNAVISEEVNNKVTKTYAYSPWGERLSQVVHKDDGSTEPTYYSYNGHSDVDAVTDDNGDTKATYGYTAYGASDDAESTGADKPDSSDPTKEPYNAYRFNADRWDPAGGTYDMGFRTYDPGLNRFLTRDSYNGALGDMNLAVDPFTGNRYAFGGGNPLTAIEIDGHGWLSALGHAALDAAGMIPVVGAVADVANAVWYTAEGDYGDAALSLAGAIPVIGDAALGARYAIRGAKYAVEGVEAAKDIAHGAEAAEDIYKGVKTTEKAAQEAKQAEKVKQEAAQAKAAAERAQAARRAAEKARAEAQAEAKAEAKADEAASQPPKEGEDLYRGVWPEHPDYADALNGDAVPRGWGKPGPKLSPAEHNAGVKGLSDYTSWTTNLDLATRRAKGGVVLRVPRGAYPEVASPDYFNEAEVLINGPVRGAERLQ